MPAADVFIIGSYAYRTADARKGYGREIAKSLQYRKPRSGIYVSQAGKRLEALS